MLLLLLCYTPRVIINLNLSARKSPFEKKQPQRKLSSIKSSFVLWCQQLLLHYPHMLFADIDTNLCHRLALNSRTTQPISYDSDYTNEIYVKTSPRRFIVGVFYRWSIVILVIELHGQVADGELELWVVIACDFWYVALSKSQFFESRNFFDR